jgi:hypothetical protein
MLGTGLASMSLDIDQTLSEAGLSSIHEEDMSPFLLRSLLLFWCALEEASCSVIIFCHPDSGLILSLSRYFQENYLQMPFHTTRWCWKPFRTSFLMTSGKLPNTIRNTWAEILRDWAMSRGSLRISSLLKGPPHQI